MNIYKVDFFDKDENRSSSVNVVASNYEKVLNLVLETFNTSEKWIHSIEIEERDVLMEKDEGEKNE